MQATDIITDRDISLTFLKGMSVLRAFDEDQTHMSIADIARATGLDPATARRLVLTLGLSQTFSERAIIH